MDFRRIDKYRLRMDAHGEHLIPATVFLPEEIKVEAEALAQLADVTTIDAEGVALATPDIHTGYGVPIGAVFASPKFISPSAVGYDINCGMRVITTPLRVEQVDIVQLAESIRRDIPLGEGMSNMEVSKNSLKQLLEKGVPAIETLAKKEDDLQYGLNLDDLHDDIQRIEENGAMNGDVEAVPDRAMERGKKQLATLGGGNHFIELQRVMRIDDAELANRWGLFEGQFVVMLHSGSRGFGHEIGGHYMKIAVKAAEKYHLRIPNRELAYVPIDSHEGRHYYKAMCCAANFAFVNRQLMAQLVRRNIRHFYGPDLPLKIVYDVPHNIAKFESVRDVRMCVHRKGATRAFPARLMRGSLFEETGQPVLIPGSMGTASYLLVGTESASESLYSVNHGAGRVMSRTAAVGKFGHAGEISDSDFERSMKGIHLICADRRFIKEEAPAAYKNIDAVVDTVIGAGLAKCVARMIPLAVLKG